MTPRAVLVDTALFAYTLGEEHPMKAPSLDVLRATRAGKLRLHASVEMVQELLFHRMRKTDRPTAVAQARTAADLCTLHDFDRMTLATALELTARHDRIGGRDAVHAATALQHGLRMIISPDGSFDGLDGLRRIGPAELLADLGG